jgi:hypothetical protein
MRGNQNSAPLTTPGLSFPAAVVYFGAAGHRPGHSELTGGGSGRIFDGSSASLAPLPPLFSITSTASNKGPDGMFPSSRGWAHGNEISDRGICGFRHPRCGSAGRSRYSDRAHEAGLPIRLQSLLQGLPRRERGLAGLHVAVDPRGFQPMRCRAGRRGRNDASPSRPAAQEKALGEDHHAIRLMKGR